MAHLYRTNGAVEDIAPRNGRTFELDELYEMLSRELIEVVRLGKQIMVIDEEGKFTSKPVNGSATRIARANYAIRCDDCIVGDALVCEDNQLE